MNVQQRAYSTIVWKGVWKLEMAGLSINVKLAAVIGGQVGDEPLSSM